MSVKLNHTIVHSRDKRAAAEFLAGVFGLAPPKPYAFLVGDEEFERFSGASRSAAAGACTSRIRAVT